MSVLKMLTSLTTTAWAHHLYTYPLIYACGSVRDQAATSPRSLVAILSRRCRLDCRVQRHIVGWFYLSRCPTRHSMTSLPLFSQYASPTRLLCHTDHSSVILSRRCQRGICSNTRVFVVQLVQT
ncbi:hypothetical protein L596_003941 [Steinernema carpocapsae]|uniref:Secreted protein n=1 Tax=Steinernema carpocapsae TaxID=34508 RepID=A0A4U8UUA4_STECR|nr:hypothetical protein L596_003941 [Steinernema carpocapsae]